MSNLIPISVMQNTSIPNMQLAYPVYPLKILSTSDAIYGHHRAISMTPNNSRYKVRNGKWSLNGAKRRLATGYKVSLKNKTITRRIRRIGFRDTEYEDE